MARTVGAAHRPDQTRSGSLGSVRQGNGGVGTDEGVVLIDSALHRAALDELRLSLASLKARRAYLAQNFTTDYPELRNIDSRIASMVDAIESLRKDARKVHRATLSSLQELTQVMWEEAF